MVTEEEIRQECERLEKGLGPKFFKELGQAIHQGMKELERERTLARHRAHQRMLTWKDRCCEPMRG